jgi:hypothetical protein
MPLGPDPAWPLLASERHWSRILGIGRQTLAQAIRSGALVASRPGNRALRITRQSIVSWLETTQVPPTAFGRQRVDEVLRREARRRAAATQTP